MYRELDVDGDGSIDFPEFEDWYVKNIIDTKILEGRTMTKAGLVEGRIVRSFLN